jgi:hypothetical protein
VHGETRPYKYIHTYISSSKKYCQVKGRYYQTRFRFVIGSLSLMKQRVCRLQLLLVLASVVILGSGYRGARDHILRFETPPTCRARSPYLYPPGTGWPSFTPQALGSLFVVSYDSQGYGGGIRPRLQARLTRLPQLSTS